MTAPPRPASPIVSVSDLHVRFVSRDDATVHAVNGVDFELARGEVLGVLGESGSGKTVLLRALMGLLPPRRTRIEGCIVIDGHDVLALDPAALRDLRGAKVAMIFQEPMTALDPVFTVGEQIAEAVVRHDGISRRAAYRRARELLEMVQIPSAARRLQAYPHEMSGGMRQRAMIAVALSCRPSVLLADEPTTALDVTVQIQLILLLRALQKDLGMAVVFVTHDVGVVAEISDRLAVMYAGRFVEVGAVDTVIRAPAHPYTAALLASTVAKGGRERRLDAISGMPPDLRLLPPGCSFEPRCRFADPRCRAAVPPLLGHGADRTTRCLRMAAGDMALAAPGFAGN
jgi:peptide/nickel transport system ATP-binding protein